MKVPYWIVLIGVLWLDAVEILPVGFDNDRSAVRILDQRILYYDKIGKVDFREISDIAYDPDRHVLYMVGDEGALFAFDARFDERIAKLEPVKAAYLRKKNGKRFKRWMRDSEGMTLDAKGRLWISFEGEPRIAMFATNNKDFGKIVRKIAIAKRLRDPKRYRSKNKALEALAYHPRYGLLTVPEWPLKRLDKKCHTIYGVQTHRTWCFRGEKEAKSGISAMEVMPNGNLLVLERSFRGFLEPLVVTLKRIDLERCRHGKCPAQTLLKMSTHQGWDIDNFEGLARISGNRYVMISDDNDNFFQKTLLVYFEVR